MSKKNNKSQTNTQLHILYLNSALNAFHIAAASWVALLATREFSLVEIGLAESVFHITSLLFEIPSGVIADVFGRKRSMLISQCMMIASAIAMLLSPNMPGILLGMVLSALGYNFASGSREALAYESLKMAGRESEYDSYASTDMMIYRFCGAAATLCAGLALFMGYRLAYLTDAVLGVVCLLFTFGLKEAEENDAAVQKAEEKSAGLRMAACFRDSFVFIAGNGKVIRLIFVNAAVGAAATLLGFFLQARLPECGLPTAALGPVLFFMGLGGVAGAKLVVLVRNWSYRSVCTVAAVAVAFCLLLSFVKIPLIMAVCGFTAALFDDFLEVCSDVRLNEMVPSWQRATLISISSLCFSVVMILLSPVLGALFSL